MAKRTSKDTKKITQSTVAEYERRVNMVCEMVLTGLSRYEISATLEKQNVKVSYRQITRYIQDANKIINDSIEDDRDTIRNKFLAQYNMLLKKTVMSKDYKTAASILEKQSKMIGVAEPKEDNDKNNVIEFIHKIVR